MLQKEELNTEAPTTQELFLNSFYINEATHQKNVGEDKYYKYVDKDGKYQIEAGLTPLEFFNKYIGEEIDDFVSVINAPTKDKKYNKTYSIEYVGHVYGGTPVTHLNLSYDRMEKAIINQA